MARGDLPGITRSKSTFTPQRVTSTAKSKDRVSQTLGKLSQASFKEAQQIENNISSSNYVDTLSSLEDARSQADQELRRYPGQADNIKQNKSSLINNLVETTKLNNKDRQRLKKSADSISRRISEKANAVSYKFSQKQNKLDFISNWPNAMQDLQHTLINGNKKDADAKFENLDTALKTDYKAGVITGSEYQNAIEQMHSKIQAAHQYLDMKQQDNPNSTQYNRVQALIHGASNPNAEYSPYNAATQWDNEHNKSELNFHDELQRVYQGQTPDKSFFFNATPEQRQHLELAHHGVAKALGLINSNVPFQQIKHRLNSLETQPSTGTYQQQAEKQYLNKWVDQLKNGHYQQAMADTPAGSRIFNDFIQEHEAIQQNGALDDDQKQQLLDHMKNQFANNMRSLGKAQNIPDKYIHPALPQDYENAQKGFELGNNPDDTLNALQHYNKTNKNYIANSFDDADQAMVTHILSSGGDNLKENEKRALVIANQKGQNFDNISSEGKSETSMKAATNEALSNVNDYIKQQFSSENTPQLQAGLTKATENLAKYYATQAGDNNLQNWGDHVDKAVKTIKKGFNIKSGHNWVANMNALPSDELDKKNMDILAAYTTHKAKQRWENHSHLNEQDINFGLERNPFTMVVSPTGDIAVKYHGGQEARFLPPDHSQHFTSSLLAKAQDWYEKNHHNTPWYKNRFATHILKDVNETALGEREH